MSSRASRAGRGWLVALVATVVAALSHTLAGGAPPSFFGMAASLVLAGTACALLSARRQSLWRLTVSVAVSQVLFHALFSGMGTPTPAAHLHAPTLAELTPVHEHAGSMWLAHVAAGLLTIAVLRHAESAAWGLGRVLVLVAGWMRVPEHPSTPRVVRAPAAPVRVDRPRLAFFARTALSYRGPPRELRVA